MPDVHPTEPMGTSDAAPVADLGDETIRVEHRYGTAEELHGAEPDPAASPALWVCHVDRPTLVLGSTQHDGVVDHAVADAAGVAVARRRSGGGAVLLWPGEHLWVDIVLRAGDRRWHDDVSRASIEAGGWWLTALAPSADGAVPGSQWSLHAAGADRTGPGGLLCMAGRGPGEVLLDDRKVVGISQRRTRTWCRIQGIVHRRMRAELCTDLLQGPAAGPALDASTVASTVATVASPPVGPSDDALVARLAAALASRA